MKNNKLKRIYFFPVLFIFFGLLIAMTFPLKAEATSPQLVPCGIGGDKANQCTLCHLVIGILNILKYGYSIAFVIALASVTFAGVMYLVSSGNESLMTSAKNFMKASLIGFAVIFLAWIIVNTLILWVSNESGFIRSIQWNEFTCDTTPNP